MRPLDESLFAHRVQHRQRRAAGERIAAEGGSMGAGREGLGCPTPRETRAYGHAVTERLGDRHDIRNRFAVLMSEPASGAAHAGLDLVQHQQPIVPVAERTQPGEIIILRHDHAAFAKHRFDQHRDHFRVAGGNFRQGFDIVVGETHETLHQRLEASVHFWVAGGAQRRQRAAVEAALGDRDLGRVDATRVTTGARNLDRRLVRLGAGITEEHAVHTRELHQRFRKTLLVGDCVEVRGVYEATRLLRDGLGDGGMGVPEAAYGNTGQRVQVALTLAVEQPRAITVAEAHGQARVGRHDRRGHSVCRIRLNQ